MVRSQHPPSPGIEVAVFAGDDVKTYPIPLSGSVSIGRAEENDVQIDHPSVSRRHAVLRVGPPLTLEDLGGRNGTFLHDPDGARGAETVSTVQLRKGSAAVRVGESITLGTTTLVIRRAHEEAAPAVEEVGSSPEMSALLDEARLAAGSLISVLILGETGVGKEVLARAIHRMSPRANRTFLAVNCAALSESLLESELFGHERGAFTGALQTRPGLFEAADGGTLFLDEVGELPTSIQVKLLRVLEERQVMRVGARAARKVDVRFLSATNRDLAAEVERGVFRRDLYYRLDGISLTIPPLRRRASEIGPLANTFIEEACGQMDRGVKPGLSREALGLLERHGWPGNVRELRHAIERAVVLCRGDVLLPQHFPAQVAAAARASTMPGAPSRPAPEVTMPAPAVTMPAPAPGPEDAVARLTHELEDAERRRVIQALEQCQGNQTKAAAMLGISRTTLVARLEAYGLPRPRKKG